MSNHFAAVAVALTLAVALPSAALAQGARDAATVLMPEQAEANALYTRWGLADAVVHGDTVWLSGVVAFRNGEESEDASYDRAFRRVGAVLARAGVSWDDVVEMTTYHTDIAAQMPAFVAVKQRYVRAPFPAWTAIDIDRLVPERGLVEIKVVAKKPSPRQAP